MNSQTSTSDAVSKTENPNSYLCLYRERDTISVKITYELAIIYNDVLLIKIKVVLRTKYIKDRYRYMPREKLGNFM